MEADILLALQFELGRPTINTFLRLDCVMKQMCLLIILIGCMVHRPHFVCFCLFFMLGLCRRFSRVAQEDFKVSLKPTFF